MKFCYFDSCLVYLPLRIRYGLHHRPGVNILPKASAMSLSQTWAWRSAGWMQPLYVFAVKHLVCSDFLSAACLPACVSASRLTCVHLLSLVSPHARKEYFVSFKGEKTLHYVMEIYKHTARPNHFHSLPFLSSVTFSATHINISVLLFYDREWCCFSIWCFCVCLLFPLLPVTSFTWWPGCVENGSIPPSMGWRSGK